MNQLKKKQCCLVQPTLVETLGKYCQRIWVYGTILKQLYGEFFCFSTLAYFYFSGFQCTKGRKVVKFELEKTEFALFPSLIHQDGFSMHMYGGRESLKRDCHGHYFFSANVKRDDNEDDLQTKFMGLQRQHNFQGYMMKFTPGFSQAWAKMIDVEAGINPLVKDVALDSSGKIYAMITYESTMDGSKVCW